MKAVCSKVAIVNVDTTREILARIAKATARKCGCDIIIDFEDKLTIVEFVGSREMLKYVAEEIDGLLGEICGRAPDEP